MCRLGERFLARSAVLLTICLASLLAGCSSATRDFTGADEQAIRAASDEYVRLEVSGDAEKWAALSTPDVVMMPEREKTIQGRDGLVAWARQLPAGGKLAVSMREIRGYGKIAIERGSYTATASAQQNAPPQTATGNYLVVWERQPSGSWLITRNIWNSDLP